MSDGTLGPVKERLEAWVGRPPRRSAGAARMRVLARLEEPRRFPRFLPAAAAAAVLGLTLALLVVVPRWPVGVTKENATTAPTSALRQPMLVYELSSGAMLYFTLTETQGAMPGEPESGQGEES